MLDDSDESFGPLKEVYLTSIVDHGKEEEQVENREFSTLSQTSDDIVERENKLLGVEVLLNEQLNVNDVYLKGGGYISLTLLAVVFMHFYANCIQKVTSPSGFELRTPSIETKNPFQSNPATKYYISLYLIHSCNILSKEFTAYISLHYDTIIRYNNEKVVI